MKLMRLAIGELGSMHSDIVVVDQYSRNIIFFSSIAYSTLVNASIKELKKTNLAYITERGTFKLDRIGYEIETKKDNATDCTHVIGSIKDRIIYNENGSEQAVIYIYSNNNEDLINKVYEKVQKYSSIPVLEDWKEYIYNSLKEKYRVTEMTIFSKQSVSFNVHKLEFDKEIIKKIIKNGLQDKKINIKGSNEPSVILSQIKGLNDYLNSFGEILANKIQTSFKPKFIPGEDKYDDFMNFIDDYGYKTANLELFEAQKSVMQAVVKDLNDNDVTFLIAEMGSGKTWMGAGIPYAHHANRTKGFNAVVICPSHLTIKWKREVEERVPNAKAYIVQDFKELIKLEPKLRNKKKAENTYIILSKERAKMGYDLRPAAIWSRNKNTFICPECGETLWTKEYEGSGRNRTEIHVPFTSLSMTKQYAYNKKCMNIVRKWNNEKQCYEKAKCNASLWQPLNRDDQDHKWFKLGSEGWIYKDKIVPLTEKLMNKESLSKKETALFAKLMEQYELIQAGEEPYSAYKGAKKYPIAKYIRERMKGVFDYCLVDECHEMKGLTEQGQAAADIISSSKKSVLLTGTLLNGYADGLYYLLWRAVPKTMRKEGFSFEDEGEFARIYGVNSRETRYVLRAGARLRRAGGIKEKRLPGVSPLVFTNFLLEHAAFLALSDMSSGLPGYEEIPVPVVMDYDLSVAYNEFETAFREYAGNRRQSRRSMGPFLQNLSIYPDCPYMVSPIIDPETGALIYSPTTLPKTRSEKEIALLDLVKERLDAGEKVLIYYSWVNKTDIGESLINLLKENNINAKELKSNVSPEKREAWVEKNLNEGMQVMICNPSLVETGLDLLDFTSIIFYQMTHELFTMRQASRRSWRLSQSKDVKVYFMYYQSSIQEQTLSLMATKLQAAMALEGKFSEEGLRAMSNNEDILTQIANNVVNGIKDSVNKEIFKSSAFVKSEKAKNRKHDTDIRLLTCKLNSKGNKTIFSNEEIEQIPERKITILNEDLLNKPIHLFC